MRGDETAARAETRRIDLARLQARLDRIERRMLTRSGLMVAVFQATLLTCLLVGLASAGLYQLGLLTP